MLDAGALTETSSIFDRYYSREDTLTLLGDVRHRRVLDAGCGSGAYASDLLDRGAHVVGMDIDPVAAETAERHLHGRAEFHVADLSKPLDFVRTNSFDVVLASLVMHYLADWSTPLQEFWRALKLDGKLVISIHHPFSDLLESAGQDYWAVEQWSVAGEREIFWRRSLHEVFEPIMSAGFVIDALREPHSDVVLGDPRLKGIPRLLILAATKI